MSEELENRLWQKKPVVIEAMRWTGASNDDDDPVAEWILDVAGDIDGERKEDGWHLFLVTLEGRVEASPGDWIIKGVQGEFYPCKPDIFEATYQKPDAASLRARPQEPGDFISRSEVLKALQDVRDGAERSREMAATIHDVDAHRHMNVLRQGYESAIEIVSALSAPSGPLSDPLQKLVDRALCVLKAPGDIEVMRLGLMIESAGAILEGRA